MYRVVYNKLEFNADVVQANFFDRPTVEITSADVEARVKYLETPCSVGATFQSKVVDGSYVVYTVLSCTLEERNAKRVRFTAYRTNEVEDLEAKIARLELENFWLNRAFQSKIVYF